MFNSWHNSNRIKNIFVPSHSLLQRFSKTVWAKKKKKKNTAANNMQLSRHIYYVVYEYSVVVCDADNELES